MPLSSPSPHTPVWITGTSRTGKTERLIAEFYSWVRKQLIRPKTKAAPQNLASAILVFAANNQNRRQLSDRLVLAVDGNLSRGLQNSCRLYYR